MRVSIDWLGDYVNAGLEAAELGEKLTRSGIAVENVLYRNKGLDKVVVGKIVEMIKHPEADRLWICTVDTGAGVRIIVTGAQNVRVGQKVPVALPGAHLPKGVKIEESVLRGIPSSGMLCSAEELGLEEKTIAPEDREGILILSDDAATGQPVSAALGLDDAVLELELTPNRADCLAVLNVAREVAAITGADLRLPEVTVSEKGEGCAEAQVKVTIEESDLCGRYAARLFTNLRLGPSPTWMQQRLQAAGMRPINNIVDITNYVMLELGHPLHAFDYDRIKDGHIIVRRARSGEKLVTLDGQERELNPENLVIADPEKAVGLAGVMGGLNSEISAGTTTVLLEAAHFHPANIRRTARQLGLRSEASQRFEKGVNIDTVVLAMNRAAQLVADLNVADVVPGYVDNYLRKVVPLEIPFSVDRINALLGTRLTGDDMDAIFQRLRFPVKWLGEGEKRSGLLSAPAYRPDLQGEHDLAEEVARLYGYDRIPTTLPKGETTVGQRTWPQTVRERIADTLVGAGLREVVTFSFINPRHLDRLGLPAEDLLRQVVSVQNPLSEEQGILRPTILPGLLEVAARNASRRIADLAIFEIGSTFSPRALPLKELPDEPWKVSALVMGEEPIHWSGKPKAVDFYYLKGIAEKLLATLKIDDVAWQREKEVPYLHPGRSARLTVEREGVKIQLGVLGEVHPDVREAYDLVGRPVVMELDLSALTLLARAKGDYTPLPRYPSTDRDMAMVLPLDIPASQVEAVIAETGGEILERWRLFDVYQGNQIAQGYRSLAYTLRYQAPDRTLTDDEVNSRHESIKAALVERLGARFR
ncbi:phenylalanyl-tRNA synthetase, beta subunit [Heliomicrobium modesticaldum Ice1]|uniref:Phenylalanine--tRNA ligase beta subunit n=1 Tax=Heliobacterium modesticaldum (strain ATCC 51547 / Ice1) TaxID=498761 RepID=B0TEW1_HELMI|nr:phenylalanine--tRNA ligase subunit beta [Heliomicrobium modesticaldum]ABZ84363.1 phenylalanyl-tRNA synthetase, beta subunit [Heliomicrobium modesticaldum Ice1]